MELRLEGLGLRRSSTNFSMLAGAIAVAIGLVVLIGWAIESVPLRSVAPGLASMKANAAVCFVLCGSSLALRTNSSRDFRPWANAAASLAIAIGLLTLAEVLLGADFGIDTLLFSRAAHTDRALLPGRMAPAVAVSFALAGTALVVLRSKAAGWIAVAIAVVALVIVAGYAYSLATLHRLVSFTTYPLLSAFGLIVLAAGILFADPRIARALRDHGPAGTVLRRLIPAAVIIPTLLAWLAQEGERWGIYKDPIGLGVMAVATIMTFGVVIWVTARSIAASEANRAAVATSLSKSEASYRTLFDSAPVGLSHTLADGTIIQVNHAFARMLGFADVEALKQANAYSLYARPEDRTRLREKLIAEGTISEEVEGKRADGKLVWVQMHSRLVQEAGGMAHYENALIDITQRKNLEQQFVQVQKMEAVGRLAGGVAHDFNNLLTVIRSYCDLVLLELPETATARDDLRQISAAADRAAALARQLLSFSRKQVMLPQVLHANAIVQEVHSMLSRVLPGGVKCELIVASDLAEIRADPGQVDQVLMNLAINASDAMPGGGRLLIETSNCTIDATYARQHTGVQPGEYVCIAVSDTGTGMDRETLSHIFEPFYTTKPVGKGTGLGLATVYGIVQQNHGHVFVYSELGEGTTFKVYFPQVAASADTPPKRAPLSSVRPAGVLPVVLVVEDDEAVRGTIAKLLGLQGYTVLTAGHGGEGMRVGTAHAGPIDLIISDVMMPEMGGREFVTRFAKVHPESRVLLMSGYTDDDVLLRGLLDPSIAFLEKPFTAEELVRRVQGVLA